VVPVDDYLEALGAELSKVCNGSQPDALSTLYFGGGTPSRLGPDGVRRAMDLVRSHFRLSDDAEVTLEANPEDVSHEAVSAWADAGINRLSLGIQSFDDRVLAWMHRTHDAAQGAAAISTAKNAGISNLSVDLIFALPEELDRSWRDDLRTALDLGPNHISLYGLTIEKGTPLGRWEAGGRIAAAPEERYAEQFLLAHEMAGEAGFGHYEVSNFAVPGAESRHNSAYWSGARYLGAGPSAHSFDGSSRRWNVAPYADWRARLSSGESVIAETELLTDDNRRAEEIYLGLRTIRGYRASAADLEAAQRWTGPEWAVIENDLISLTPEGWLRLDSLAAGLTGL
jgi:oxygen-independent coproporphyrinogen-3 oxidase